jgi:hypothetical protein
MIKNKTVKDGKKMKKTIEEIKEILRGEKFIDAEKEIYTEKELYNFIKKSEVLKIKDNLKEFITDNYNSVEDFMNFLDCEKVWNFIHYTLGIDWHEIEQDTELNNLKDYLMYMESTYLDFSAMVDLIIKYDLFIRALFGIEDMLYRENEDAIIESGFYKINDIMDYDNEKFYTLND